MIERSQAKGVLVPILEETLERPLDVEDKEDFDFMLHLMKARATKREKGVFSPSMLSSCMRQSYFAKTEVEKRFAKSPRSNAYFLDGNFRHYKWQFALWKAHRKGLLTLIAVEVRVYHPNGDFAGTIDAIVEIDGEVFIVDFKGMRVDDFQLLERDGAKFQHRVQIVGYGMIYNLGVNAKKVKRCILVGENKGGPTQKGSPIALHEEVIEVARYKREVKTRIATLRKAVADEKVPEPACTTTRIKQFQECPFAYICREEVKIIQREREGAARGNTKGRKVAVPKRTRASGSNTRTNRRKTNPS